MEEILKFDTTKNIFSSQLVINKKRLDIAREKILNIKSIPLLDWLNNISRVTDDDINRMLVKAVKSGNIEQVFSLLQWAGDTKHLIRENNILYILSRILPEQGDINNVFINLMILINQLGADKASFINKFSSMFEKAIKKAIRHSNAEYLKCIQRYYPELLSTLVTTQTSLTIEAIIVTFPLN
ncbi:hypothetical protein FOG18_01650 [Legionella israelensis]|uniref:hypothetical protein n=1 Tax=Legionella israelensis TaxID=454 RepID=UPI00117D33DF|nr:hypothetical protein [Legionella israelensis]QDP71373.1 hypothetical protein FOG18_01650 [Legionella israelensis]